MNTSHVESKKNVMNYFPFIVPVIKAFVFSIKYPVSKNYIRQLLREGNEIFLEIGAGDKKGTGGWITMDMRKNCDIFWDLRYGIPFPDKSITKIYSSHFLEHLLFRDGQKFLDECRRVLVSGGTFSICVPNARIYIESYLKSDPIDEQKFFGWLPAYNRTTAIDLVNYVAYMDGQHKYMFDEENLLYILKSKGFKNVCLRQFDPSIDLEARDFGSIYAQAEN